MPDSVFRSVPLLPYDAENASAAKSVFLIFGDVDAYLTKHAQHMKGLVDAQNFTGKRGELVIGEKAVLIGLGKSKRQLDPLTLGKASRSLPKGLYKFAATEDCFTHISPENAALGWALGCYYFNQYKEQPDAAQLMLPESINADLLINKTQAVYLTRDLINTPAEDMGPEQLAEIAKTLATQFKAKTNIIQGEQLIKQNFPLVHVVGRAAEQAPRLVDITWGDKDAPKVTLVGKGVTFDVGGVNVKGGEGMSLMKKDMGGAANTIGLGAMIMAAGLNVRLRMILPIVKNAISGNAFLPGDIYKSRKGLTVEIGNTDAEGRLILADSLTLAGEDDPEIIISLATLTGAARIALGPDLAPMYCDDDEFVHDVEQAGIANGDLIWRMPFYSPYNRFMASEIADVNHISNNSFAGSITAANFLKRFVPSGSHYTHFDIYGWNPAHRAGRPKGGEALAIRALFDVLAEKYK